MECLSFTIWIAQLSYDEEADPVQSMLKMCELPDDDYASVSEFYEVVTAKDPWIFKQVYGEEAFEVFKRVSANAVKYTQKMEAKMIREMPIK